MTSDEAPAPVGASSSDLASAALAAGDDDSGAPVGGGSSSTEREEPEEERRRSSPPSSPTTVVASAPSTSPSTKPPSSIVREGAIHEIPKLVLRAKLNKMRHLVMERLIRPEYLDSIFPELLRLFDPQTVVYNGGIANVKEWNISCYLEVMDGGVPTAQPNLKLLEVFRPLLDECDKLFWVWHRQQRSCNSTRKNGGDEEKEKDKVVKRLMTFVTRYTPAPGEQALLKHVDGAGKVDGSVVVALPIEFDRTFVGHGGGLTFWDGRQTTTEGKRGPREITYDTRSGDVAFIDRAVWHQANPITKGTRWALVIFYEVKTSPPSSS